MTTTRVAGAVAASAMAFLLAVPAPAEAAGGSATAAAASASLEPSLSGVRLVAPNNPKVYLIDPEGCRRWIPNPATFDNLFRDWTGIITDIWTDRIDECPPLDDGAFLARGDRSAPVYLISNGQKRWIVSPPVFNKYWFAWDKVRVLPQAAIDAIPTGPNWV